MKFKFYFSIFILFSAILTIASSVSAQTVAVKLNGNPIGTNQQSARLAFDSSPGTVYWAPPVNSQISGNPNSLFSWVGLEFDQPCVITKVTWTKSEDPRYPASVELGVFMGANNEDFSDALPLWIIRNDKSGEAEIKCSKGFRFVKYVGPSQQNCGIAELEFYGYQDEGTDDSYWQVTNLPTVVINTVAKINKENQEVYGAGEIPFDKDTEIPNMTFIISDNQIKLNESAGIRERGNASRDFPKKPWRLKFDSSTKVLDSPAKGKKWTLINNYGDKTLMRNLLAFDVAEKFKMDYVPFRQPVDVILNGEYKGCYQLCDQIDVRKGRVNIKEFEEGTEIDNVTITGGYFIEVDAYADQEASNFVSGKYRIPVTIKSPDEDFIAESQTKYITDYFTRIENLLDNPDPVEGYRKMFDTESFIKHMLVNEVAGNTDCYWSTYMYKDRDVDGVEQKMFTGPVWDFDLGFNNDYRTYPVYEKSGYGYLWNTPVASSANGMKTFAQKILIDDESTADEIKSVWEKAKNNGLSAEWLIERVKYYAEMLAESQELNFKRWPILNTSVHMNPRALGSYEAECEAVMDYIDKQMVYLDNVVNDTFPEDEVPTFVPEPKHDPDKVLSFFSSYGNNVDYNVGAWNQSTNESLTEIGGKDALLMLSFNYQGWVDFNIDISDYDYMHVDYWTPVENTKFGFVPISLYPTVDTPIWWAPEVKAAQWNSYDAPLKNFKCDKTKIEQIKFDIDGLTRVGYIANVYFWKNDAPKVEYPESPENVPTPVHSENDVLSFFSNYGNNVNFNFPNWGQTTQQTVTNIGESNVIMFEDFNFQGLDGFNINVSDYDYMHVDYWTPEEDTVFGFVPISFDPTVDTPIWWAKEVKAGEWNSYDAPLKDFGANLSKIQQIKFKHNDSPTTRKAYVANIYFWKDNGTSETPSDSKSFYRIDNGFLINARKVDEGMPSRNFPVSMKTQITYNDDKTLSIRFNVKGAENIDGFVPEININGEWSDNLTNTKDAEGYYNFKTKGTFERGQTISNYYWLKFAGFNNQTIDFSTKVGDVNEEVDYGVPAKIILSAGNSTEVYRNLPAWFNAYLVDENGNFLLDIEPEISIDSDDDSGDATISKMKYFISLGKKGTSTVVASYNNLPPASLMFTCKSDAWNLAYGLVPELQGSVTQNSKLESITDEKIDTEVMFDCSETEEHTIKIKFDKSYTIEFIRIIWEGASASEYDFRLFVEPDNAAEMPSRAQVSDYKWNVDNGAGGGGILVTYDHEPIETVSADTFTLTTHKAFELGWGGIKLRQVYVYGANDMSTSVDAITFSEDDSDLEFYNLYGIRVVNPSSGVYIKRQGSKVEKVIIR